ncbi:MAG: alpha-amylase family protein [Phycisphaerae bacterium]|jgi:hypothetical protein
MTKNIDSNPCNKTIPFWQWLKETPVAILEENELPVWSDPSEVVEAVKAMGAEFIRYPAIGWGAHFYDKSDWLPKYPLIEDNNDLYGKISQAVKSHGIKIMAYCHYGVLYPELEKSHLHWLARDAEGNLLRWNGGTHYMSCMCNESFIEAMRNAITEVVSKYNPDAVYLDGPTWYGICYCEHCRKLYRNKYGQDLPIPVSYTDGSLQRMNIIRDEVVANIVRGVQRAINKISKCPLCFNGTLHTKPHHRTGQPELTSAFAEGMNTTEVHRPGSLWEMLEAVKLGESLEKTSLCYLPPGPYDTLRTYDLPEMDVLGAAYLMHGATPMLGTVSSYIKDKTGAKRMYNFVKFIKANASIYYQSTSIHELGLVYSRATSNYDHEVDVSQTGLAFSGAFRALLQGHRQFDCIFDTQFTPERLLRYKAIYMPCVSVLSRSQEDMLRNFVQAGGSLIASGDFSLKDEEGKPEKNFSLSDLLGVDFAGYQPAVQYHPREYRETSPHHGFSQIPEVYLKLGDNNIWPIDKKGRLMPVSDAVVGIPELKRYIEYYIVHPHKETQTLADLFLPAGGAFGRPLDFPLGTPPGITIKKYGKGKVIYISVPLEKIYLRRGNPEIRQILVRLADIALDECPVVKLDAPAAVICNVTQNQDGTIFIHLLNYTGNMFECSNPVEYISPVNNVTVNIKLEKKPSKVKTICDNTQVKCDYKENYLRIILSQLNIFQTIIIM